jgi:hypothetical protein
VTTRVYGASDDLIEIEGDYTGEVSAYGTDDNERGVLLVFSDGTLLEVKYGKSDAGIWGVTLVKKGTLFKSIEQCDDEDSDPHSDVATFADGIQWVYAATEWEKVA